MQAAQAKERLRAEAEQEIREAAKAKAEQERLEEEQKAEEERFPAELLAGMVLNLVGGLEHQFYFPMTIGNFIIPIDFHIFQRGGPTTNQIGVVKTWCVCSPILLLNDGKALDFVFDHGPHHNRQVGGSMMFQPEP